MLRTPKCALFKIWPELNCLIDPYNLNVKDYVLEFNHSNNILSSISNIDHLEKLFAYSCRTFDVFSLVFVNKKERQVEDTRAKTTQILSNQIDYGPRHLVLSQLKTTNQNPGKRARGIQKWKDDQRFKPPDSNQNEHQNVGLFVSIKEEPPDSSSKPKTRLQLLGGKLLILSEFISTNLLYVLADNSDLRTNPFQEGGDDMILSSLQQGFKKQPNIMVLVELNQDAKVSKFKKGIGDWYNNNYEAFKKKQL